jgi:hypothetical protein
MITSRKRKVVANNVKALDLGIEYATANWKCPLSFHVAALKRPKEYND